MSLARIEPLRQEGWTVTERGFMRGPLRASATVTMWDGSRTAIPMLRRIGSRPSRKFRRFLFGRNSNDNPLIGWFATDEQIRRDTQTGRLANGLMIDVIEGGSHGTQV